MTRLWLKKGGLERGEWSRSLLVHQHVGGKRVSRDQVISQLPGSNQANRSDLIRESSGSR
jgi:hypothetical protein